MKFHEYYVTNVYPDGEDTVIVQIKPKSQEGIFSFLSGQYCFIKNKNSVTSSETHPFSIASSPLNKEYLEFCIKKLGDWTTEFVDTIKKGDTIQISSPIGNFIWDDKINYAVFLLGGIGISPIMSMLRYIHAIKQKPKITMLYGNRTPETVVYRKALEELKQKIPLDIIDIYSHIDNTYPWKGYRGFITEEMVKNEVKLDNNPTFFVIGPPIFIQKMNDLLNKLSIAPNQIKKEQLEEKK